MAHRQGSPEQPPASCQIQPEQRRMPAVQFLWQQQLRKISGVEKVGVLGAQLHRIPEKRVMLCLPHHSNDEEKASNQRAGIAQAQGLFGGFTLVKFERGLHESGEQWVRSLHPAFEFGVKLHAHKPGMLAQFHNLHQAGIRVDA